MTTVLEIESAIEGLPSSEYGKFLAWFEKHQATTTISGVASMKKLSGFEMLGDLVGSIKGAPRDLSFNPKYLNGYGKEFSDTLL